MEDREKHRKKKEKEAESKLSPQFFILPIAFIFSLAKELRRTGNTFFKQKDFDTALRYYQQSLEAEAFSLSTLVNIAQVSQPKLVRFVRLPQSSPLSWEMFDRFTSEQTSSTM